MRFHSSFIFCPLSVFPKLKRVYLLVGGAVFAENTVDVFFDELDEFYDADFGVVEGGVGGVAERGGGGFGVVVFCLECRQFCFESRDFYFRLVRVVGGLCFEQGD